MNNDFNFLSTLTLLGAAQGFFLALALLNTKSGDSKAHRILALLTLLFAIDLAEEFLYQIGFFVSFAELLNLLAPIDLLYGPLIYLYVAQLTNPDRHSASGRRYIHFIPVLAGILLLLPFFSLDGGDKLVFIENIRRGNAIVATNPDTLYVYICFVIFMLGTVIQIGLYLLFSITGVIRHAVRIKNEFSDIDRIDLAWLKNLLIGLTSIYFLALGDQFFPDLMGMNILGDLVTVVAVILIYAMGYLGLRQPTIFTRVRLPQMATIDESAEQEGDRKYNRSGLDQDTSRIFLDELTTHMEKNKPYLEGSLLLPELAQQLGISVNYLSQVINEQLQVNFYDFVNGYRVEEAKRLMQDMKQSKTNILGIALDSGFNSKSAFYSAFKKATSMTPSQFRKSL